MKMFDIQVQISQQVHCHFKFGKLDWCLKSVSLMHLPPHRQAAADIQARPQMQVEKNAETRIRLISARKATK